MRPKIDMIPSGRYPLDGNTFEAGGALYRLAERKNTKGRPAYYLTTEHYGFVSSLFPCDNGGVCRRFRFDYVANDGIERAAIITFGDGVVTIEDRGSTRRSQGHGAGAPAPWRRS